jgi:hypothetical protein
LLCFFFLTPLLVFFISFLFHSLVHLILPVTNLLNSLPSSFLFSFPTSAVFSTCDPLIGSRHYVVGSFILNNSLTNQL